MEIDFAFPTYKLFPYEFDLAYKEISSLSNGTAAINRDRHSIQVSTADANAVVDKIVRRSTFINAVGVGKDTRKTVQSEVEAESIGGKRRQATRYGPHGVHEYKGKFNPQVARSLLNILGIEPGKNVIDPFCGSGTTLLEAIRLGFNAYGYDMNPMAIYICKAKIESLKIHKNRFICNIDKALDYAKQNKTRIDTDLPRDKYLSSWLPEDTFMFLENFMAYCKRLKHKDVYLALASNLLRDYSYQEPSDLRIRRRISPFPTIPIWERLKEDAMDLFNKIAIYLKYEKLDTRLKFETELKDICNHKIHERKFDAGLTSPPYITALPYIDMHRISLVWLGLIEPTSIKTLEENLLGSREINKESQGKFMEILESCQDILPEPEILLCDKLRKSLTDTDGFRRRAMPCLILRYFCSMQKALRNILEAMNENSPLAMIIGTNKTVLGGHTHLIDTPRHILSIAQSVGWKVRTYDVLQTYKRYGLHSKNSINDEMLLILES